MELIKLIIVLILIGVANHYATDYAMERTDELKFEEKLMLLERQR